jgi:hypothetical protein
MSQCTQECDCSWTNDRTTCGNDDGTVCWGCCCGTNNNNGNVNGDNNVNNSGDDGLAGKLMIVILIAFAILVGSYLLYKRHKAEQQNENGIAVPVKEIERTGTEPELPNRPQNSIENNVEEQEKKGKEKETITDKNGHEWEKHLSKSQKGKVYYFNSETGQTIWTHPDTTPNNDNV